MSDIQNRRLDSALLGRLPSRIAVPRYDRAKVGQAIAHIGLGNFHRAHQALYLDDLFNARGPGPWGVCGIGLLPQDRAMAEALRPQDLLYTLVERDEGVETARIIGAQRGYLHAPGEPDKVLAQLADPATRIVSITVTEGGYYLDHGTGELDQNHPNLRHDLENPDEAPVSLYGYLAGALDRRRKAGTAPFTVLSCDNLQSNGEIARAMLTGFARLRDPALGSWIEAHVAFPNCMVDRITPVTTDLHREQVKALLGGVTDAWPVVAEPFRQWVVEDRFVGGARPDLGAVGVQLVSDVRAFELMKLRMLNGTHSSLAYLGYLAGHETVAETVADPAFAAFARRLWTDEIIPTLAPPEGEDLPAYAEALLARYANPAIRHRTWQIAMDGSQKLPQRILGTLADNRAAGRPSPGLTLAVAAWMRYVGGVDENGAAIDVRDPLADRLRALSDGAADPAGKVATLLGVREVFPDRFDAMQQDLAAAYAGLVERGARASVAEAVAEPVRRSARRGG